MKQTRAIVLLPSVAPLPIERVREAIAKCVTIDDAKHLRDKLAALEVYARHRKAHVRVLATAAAGVRWAERAIGARTQHLPRRGPKGEKTKSGSLGIQISKRRTVARIGLAWGDVVKWEKLAKISDAEFMDRIERLIAADEKVTRKAVSADAHVSKNSGENEWYTPPEFIEAARNAMGSIDTDPASSEIANRTVRAETFYTAKDDGLDHRWRGNVWLNPPYAQPLVAQFAEAVASRFESGEISQACVLVNNATETEWFRRMWDLASCVCFPAGRIKYHDATGTPANTPLQGQGIVYLGRSPGRFAAAFTSIGSLAAPISRVARMEVV